MNQIYNMSPRLKELLEWYLGEDWMNVPYSQWEIMINDKAGKEIVYDTTLSRDVEKILEYNLKSSKKISKRKSIIKELI